MCLILISETSLNNNLPYFLHKNSCVIYIVESVSSVKIAVETCDDPVCNNDPILCPGSMVCEPQPPDFYLQIELICVCFFLFDYASRLLTSWSVPPRLCGIYTPLLTEEDEALLISIEQPPEFFVEEECAKRLKVNIYHLHLNYSSFI